MRHAVATAEEGVQVISCLNPQFIHTDLLHTGRTAEYLVGEIFTQLSISRTWNSWIALAATTLSTASMAATGDGRRFGETQPNVLISCRAGSMYL